MKMMHDSEEDEGGGGGFAQYRGVDCSPGCQHCPCFLKTNPQSRKVVPAFGAPGGLVVIGEGPGQEEVFQGYPFIGPSGKLLSKACKENGIDRQLLWITNALLCPRPQTDDELARAVECCRPRLADELVWAQPRAVIALGGTAVRAMQLPVTGILEARGTVQLSSLVPGIPCVTTIHPAALLRGGAGEVKGGKQKMNVDAQFMFFSADVGKAYRIAAGQMEPSWSDDVSIVVMPPRETPAATLGTAPGCTQAFFDFHTKHPEVYKTLVTHARWALADNFKFDINTLWGATKFAMRGTVIPDLFKNQYVSFVATQEPDLAYLRAS